MFISDGEVAMKAIDLIKKNVINDLQRASSILSCSGDMFISAYEINEVIISRLRKCNIKKWSWI